MHYSSPRPPKTGTMAGNAGTDKDKDAYPLNHDLLASSRLHMMHQVWVSSLGYLLHPSIPLKENARIGDVGCGTGISSLELAKQLPSGGRIEGYDLNLAQCPPRGWWPKNVTFNELDIFEKIPQHLVGSYDVVYIRHFICVLQSGNPIPLLSALIKLLKPGGYLQWQEWDLQSNELVVADPTNPAPKMEAFRDSIRGPDSLQAQTSWVKNFHTRFSDAGAELIAHDRHRTAKEVMIIKQEINFLHALEWCNEQRARDPANLVAARIEKLTSEAYEECWRLQRGTVIDTEMVTWVARKK